MGHMFLVIVDAHSKWLDAHIMSSITATKTTETLHSVLANTWTSSCYCQGKQFTLYEWRVHLCAIMGLSMWLLLHTTPPLTGSEDSKKRPKMYLHLAIVSKKNPQGFFFFDYRITPHKTMGVAPSEMLIVCLTKSMLFNGGRLMSLNSPVGQEHSSLYCLCNHLLRHLQEFSLYWRTLFQHNKSHLSRIMFRYQLCYSTIIAVNFVSLLLLIII